ncbi:RNB domain-containing ribonuclease [Ideonella sp.]|uniref:RNB domain-containing ribonuclease n=1 Tax=Ideonella sp. TaxID=1929293 RepID=UPI0035B4DC01
MDAAELAHIAALEMQTHGLLPEFGPDVLREVQARADHIESQGPERHGDIRDLRQRLWFSIDNDDTQDLDQLSWAEQRPDGQVRLAVAVADVDTLVHQGSATDAHAAINTTSVYTAAGVFPMLPTRLSNDLTSLHEGRERLAVVVEMDVDGDGAVTGSQLYRAVVRNQAKLTYDSVAAWLDGQAGAPAAVGASPALQAQLTLHDRVARSLRHWRTRRGALNVMTAQARPVFADGQLVDLRADRKNRAKDLIADLMIATNGATARHLADNGQPSLRRVLQEPKRWDRLVKLAAEHGASLPAAPDALALDQFLTARRQAAPAEFEELSLSVVKLLGSGAYAAALPGAPASGHFGLAVNDYAHSTAPNRRFVDLVTQRLLKASLAKQPPPYTIDQLTVIAQQCTMQEDSASTVERRVLKAAAAFLLHDRIGESFDAIVTGAAPKGTFVRIVSPLVEGRVVRGFEGLDVGDTLRVTLRSVDLEQRFIDFERA